MSALTSDHQPCTMSTQSSPIPGLRIRAPRMRIIFPRCMVSFDGDVDVPTMLSPFAARSSMGMLDSVRYARRANSDRSVTPSGVRGPSSAA